VNQDLNATLCDCWICTLISETYFTSTSKSSGGIEKRILSPRNETIESLKMIKLLIELKD
jgi:hypothetical protein